MSLLTIDVGGANEQAVAYRRAGHAEPRTVGSRRYAFAGNERSMIRAEPFVFPVQLVPLPAATMATIRSVFADGAEVECSGDVFNNGNRTVTCIGTIADEMEVGGTYWNSTLTLTQVTGTTTGLFQNTVAGSGSGSAIVLLNGPRRGTVAVSGLGAVTATLSGKRQLTLTTAGAGVASVALHVRRKVTATSAARATTTVTLTKV